MNSESVIHLVRAHAELYDPNHPHYQSSEHTDQIWKIIAQELGQNISAEDAKRRWSTLRSSYLRERRRLQSLSICGDSSAKTSWPYFDMLTFLDDSEWKTPMNIQQGFEYVALQEETPGGLSFEEAELPAKLSLENPPAKISMEEIIHAVRPFEEIYDSNNPKHRNREHLAQVWSMIASQLNTNAFEAKRKWSNLRSNYNREKRKLNLVCLDGSTPRITWPYYQLLSFLEKKVHSRTEGVTFFAETYHDSSSLSADYPPETIIIKSEDEVEEIEVLQPRKRKAPDCTGIIVAPEGAASVDTAEIVDTEGDVDTEGMCLEERLDHEDPDFMFLRSLVPMMKMLGPVENLEFRGEVIELLRRKVQRSSTTSAAQLHY